MGRRRPGLHHPRQQDASGQSAIEVYRNRQAAFRNYGGIARRHAGAPPPADSPGAFRAGRSWTLDNGLRRCSGVLVGAGETTSTPYRCNLIQNDLPLPDKNKGREWVPPRPRTRATIIQAVAGGRPTSYGAIHLTWAASGSPPRTEPSRAAPWNDMKCDFINADSFTAAGTVEAALPDHLVITKAACAVATGCGPSTGLHRPGADPSICASGVESACRLARQPATRKTPEYRSASSACSPNCKAGESPSVSIWPVPPSAAQGDRGSTVGGGEPLHRRPLAVDPPRYAERARRSLQPWFPSARRAQSAGRHDHLTEIWSGRAAWLRASRLRSSDAASVTPGNYQTGRSSHRQPVERSEASHVPGNR